MKSKLKSPDVAKTKGMTHVQKCLKKVLMQPNIDEAGTPVALKFFYHSKYEYSSTATQPILFVGLEIPSLWKKWIKTVKTSTEFAAGNCILGKDMILKLEVKLGKGGKNSVLKQIKKGLLKKTAIKNVIFVDSVVSSNEVEPTTDEEGKENSIETPDSDSSLENMNYSEFTLEAEKLLSESNVIKEVIQPILDTLLPVFADESAQIITDDIIETAQSSLLIWNDVDKAQYIKDASSWLENVEDVLANDSGIPTELSTAIENIKAAIDTITDLNDKEPIFLEGCTKVLSVGTPLNFDVPPVSDDHVSAIEPGFTKVAKKAKEIADAYDSFKSSLS